MRTFVRYEQSNTFIRQIFKTNNPKESLGETEAGLAKWSTALDVRF